MIFNEDYQQSDKPALVIFSGGQDSTTCLGLAKKRHKEVYTITFSYEQRHKIEITSARLIAQKLDVPFKLVEFDFFDKLVPSALFDSSDISSDHVLQPDLPASFVVGRNAIFFTIAHSFAQNLGIDHIYTGVCQTDYSGYPDCRRAFIDHFQQSLNIGYRTNILFITPLMDLTKAEIFILAEKVGILDMVLEYSHTCYNGDRENKHDWGFGCNKCPACDLREKGWNEYQQILKAT